jgi:uncharacterized protein (TIRG00374 family)
MKINTASTIKYVSTLAIGGALLYFVFSGMDFKAMVYELKRANYTWIIVSMTITLLSHFSRAYRWNLLLKPLGYNVKLINTFQAVMIGYFANLAFPRLGEVTRCSVLKRTDDIPVDVSLGTVITERVVDVIMSGILLGLCFILEFARLKDFFSVMITQRVESTNFLSGKGLLIILLLSLFSMGLVLLSYIYRQKLMNNAFIKKIAAFLSGIFKGLLSIRKLENKWSFIFHSVFIWFIYFLVTYIIFFAMDDTSHLPVSAGLVAMVLGAFGMAAPVQGGIGAYHIMVSGALLIYGIPQEKGIILATIMHTSQALVMIICGGLSIIALALFYNKKNDVKHEQ